MFQPIFSRITNTLTELKTLEYGDEEYLRHEGETEDEFIERILAIVKKNPHPNSCYLVGNIS